MSRNLNKCKVWNRIWMTLLIALLGCLPLNLISLKATEIECKHEFETREIMKESTYKNFGKKLQACRICGLEEVHLIPKDVARIPDDFVELCNYICSTNKKYITDISQYNPKIARGDFIKSVKVVSGKECLKVISFTDTTFTLKTTNKVGKASFEICLASGVKQNYSMQIGKDFSEKSEIKNVKTQKQKSVSETFYKQVKGYAQKYDSQKTTTHINAFTKSGYKLEFHAVNDKKNKYYATKKVDKKNKKLIISFNEAKYKELKNVRIDKHLVLNQVNLNLEDENYEGPFLSHDIMLVNGDAFNFYQDPVFDEQYDYIKNLIEGSNYSEKWKLSGMDIFIVNKEGVENNYELVCDGYRYLNTAYLYIDIYNFDAKTFTSKQVDKILKNCVKMAEKTNMALPSRYYKLDYYN